MTTHKYLKKYIFTRTLFCAKYNVNYPDIKDFTEGEGDIIKID